MAGPLTPKPGSGSPCTRPELAADVLHWDALASDRRNEVERHAAGCPSCGPLLATLRQAQTWLEDRWREASGPDPCPESDELYDFGRGPGASPLGRRREEEIEDHVLRCTPCREIVRTLESRPPVPWGSEPLDEPQDETPDPARAPRALRGRLLPFGRPSWAAAAALVLAGTVAIGLLTDRGRESRAEDALAWPTTPLVRGAAASGALFPRGRVLASPGGGAFQELAFELEPADDATYRIELARTGSGAFDAGETVAVWSTDEPFASLPADVAAELRPGHYTWEAWAVESGLDRLLGARDFELRADGDLAGRVAALGPDPAPEDLVAVVRALAEAGWATDARALARRAPASPERDRFLEGQTVR